MEWERESESKRAARAKAWRESPALASEASCAWDAADLSLNQSEIKRYHLNGNKIKGAAETKANEST